MREGGRVRGREDGKDQRVGGREEAAQVTREKRSNR